MAELLNCSKLRSTWVTKMLSDCNDYRASVVFLYYELLFLGMNLFGTARERAEADAMNRALAVPQGMFVTINVA